MAKKKTRSKKKRKVADDVLWKLVEAARGKRPVIAMEKILRDNTQDLSIQELARMTEDAGALLLLRKAFDIVYGSHRPKLRLRR